MFPITSYEHNAMKKCIDIKYSRNFLKTVHSERTQFFERKFLYDFSVNEHAWKIHFIIFLKNVISNHIQMHFSIIMDSESSVCFNFFSAL